jgi:hypothetical protein
MSCRCCTSSWTCLQFFPFVCMYVELSKYIGIRRLMGSTDQADPSSFYFRIDGTALFLFIFCPLGFLQGLRSKNIK